MVKENNTKNCHETFESSMINNTSSRITFNNIKINSVNQIQNSEQNKKDNGVIMRDNYKTEKLKQDLLKNYKDVLFNNFNNENSNEYSNRSDREDINNTIEYKKNFNKENSNNTIEEVNKNDSIIYTKGLASDVLQDPNKNNISNCNNTNKLPEKESLGKKLSTVTKLYQANQKEAKDWKIGTLDSCTLSEFKSGLVAYEGSFISQGNDDIENLKIEIKNSSG